MYKKIIRPILFLLTPEAIHAMVMGLLKTTRLIPGTKCLLRAMFAAPKSQSLEREVFGIKFPNPVGLAAGFDKNAEAYNELACLGFGSIEIGTVTPKPQSGNPKPRLFRLKADGALINRMGFNNRGVDRAFEKLAKRRGNSTVVGANLGKNTSTVGDMIPKDYLMLFEKLYNVADYFVVNISCPNVVNLTSLQNKDSTLEIISPLVEFRKKQSVRRPILLKISPDLTTAQLDDMIEVISLLNLDGIVATNTTTRREGLMTPTTTLAKIGNGGLSGNPLTVRSCETVRYIHQKTSGTMPIIGVGGITSVDDAMAMLEAGASLIQVYTGFIYEGPAFVKKICKRVAAGK